MTANLISKALGEWFTKRYTMNQTFLIEINEVNVVAKAEYRVGDEALFISIWGETLQVSWSSPHCNPQYTAKTVDLRDPKSIDKFKKFVRTVAVDYKRPAGT